MPAQQRIEFFDCMRGTTMILVVFSHFILYGLHASSREYFNDFFIHFRMPLFFFISGFFAYCHLDATRFKQKLRKRLFGQFTPTIVAFILFGLWEQCDMMAKLASVNKHGLWFTLVVFEIFVILSVINYMMDRRMRSVNYKISIYAIISSIALIGIWCCKNILAIQDISNALSLPHVCAYLPFFCLGMVANIKQDRFFELLCSPKIIIGCGIAFFVTHFMSIIPYIYHRQVCGIFAIPVLCALFLHFEPKIFNSGTYVGRGLTYVGQHTLAVYFLHYFFFRFVNETTLGAILPMDILTSGKFLGFIFCLIMSLIIVGVTLAIEKLVMQCRPLYAVLFGPIRTGDNYLIKN